MFPTVSFYQSHPIFIQQIHSRGAPSAQAGPTLGASGKPGTWGGSSAMREALLCVYGLRARLRVSSLSDGKNEAAI